MRGHIAKKGNRYYAVVYEGTDPATGKQRHRWYQGGSTRREAERTLTEIVKRIHDGDYRAPEKITLGDYLVHRWLPLRKNQLGASTYDAHRRNINHHILPHLGMIPLQRLTADDLDGLYVKLLTEGRRNGGGGGLSPKTVRNIHGLLHKALSDATRKGAVLRNVALQADPPRVRSHSAMRVWNAEQLRQFLTEIDDHRMAPAFYVAANTGMRRGEVLGLTWSAVDLEDARVSVHQAVTNVAYEKRVGDVKTSTGRRMVDLDARTVEVLRRWRQVQAEEQDLTGLHPGDSGFVFAKPDGSPIHPDYMSQLFERRVEASTLPRIRLHDLRHTHATILLKAGVPVKVVSERLGHSSPAFTMTVYQHVLPGMQAEAAAKFGEALWG